ncbi:MAG TPA: TIGR04255 family protein [Pirellulales bacterium]|nr:TIGR04255 family protein [Pirellulales bacterium]
MTDSRAPSVTYDRPPVVEVALSVQFDPPPGFNAGHFGAFWATQKDRFGTVATSPPISTPAEKFGGEGQWLPPTFGLGISNDPQCRVQMTSDDGEWMGQIQADRLVLNWRKKAAAYPRFGEAYRRFLDLWRALHVFIVNERLASPAPRLWEVTYVNRIPKGELWNSPQDWKAVFPGLWAGGSKAADGLIFRGFQGRWVWDSHRENGRLYIDAYPASSADDPKTELLMVSLTARGPMKPTGEQSGTAEAVQVIKAGMDLGHDLIVSTFDTVGSDIAKKHWGRHE